MDLILLYSLAALAMGIIVGLLPGLPVFLAPLLMLPFAQFISTEAMLMVWMLSVIGSQFFGSVAVITTKIPGEENTLIYINDLDRLTVQEKIALIKHTAFGSAMAGIVGALILYIGFHTLTVDPGFFAQAWIQVLIYSLLLISFVVFDQRRWVWSLALVAVGLILSTKNNYVLPGWWLNVQHLFDQKTLFMMTLGLLIIPHAIKTVSAVPSITKQDSLETKNRSWWPSWVGSLVGFFAGLIPGPSAYTGSFLAYRCFRAVKSRIVAAESANNAAVIATALPFLLTAIPINQNTLLLSAAIDLNQVEINHAIWETGSFGIPLIDQLILAIAIVSLIFYYLSTRFISSYMALIEFFHSRTSWLLILILFAMCVIDINTSNNDPGTYFMLGMFFTTIGLLFNRLQINPLPFLFACIIGDRVVWSFLQLWRIYL